MESRILTETVEGEIALVLSYKPGVTAAVDLLSGAIGLVRALEGLDKALLSSVDTSLEPVSILNDVQQSSLKMLLSRALKHVPDNAIDNLDWKKWVGSLLVKGKYALLKKLDADAPEVSAELDQVFSEAGQHPGQFLPFEKPRTSDVLEAMEHVRIARAALPDDVVVQTEEGDVLLPNEGIPSGLPDDREVVEQHTSSGVELFRVRSPDMLGEAQWTMLRGKRQVRVEMLHRNWLSDYHAREIPLKPGDSLRCRFEETIGYNRNGDEIERKLAIVEVLGIHSPPEQMALQ